HYPSWKTSSPARSQCQQRESATGSRRCRTDPRAGGGFASRNIRLADLESRSGFRPAMSVVLDSSVALAWVYAEETTNAIRQVFELVSQAGAWVPSLWRLEVANILEMGVRRGRHDARFRDATLADLELLPIHVDPETDRWAWKATLRLAEHHRLTL